MTARIKTSASLALACLLWSCAHAAPTVSHSFTSGLVTESGLLLGKRESQMSEENRNRVLLWSVSDSKIIKFFELPEKNRDVIEFFASDNVNECFLLTQIQLAGSDYPNLLKLNISKGTIETVVPKIDCADLLSVKASKGRLAFKCGTETPTPPKKESFNVDIKGLRGNDLATLTAGTKLSGWALSELKKDDSGKLVELAWRSSKGAIKTLKAAEALPPK